MQTFRVGPEDLAASRFAIAPLVELEQLLRKLDTPASRTAVGAAVRASRWAARYAPLRMTLQARVLRALRPPSWGVDFTAPPPTGMARAPADDLALVRATPIALARAQIAQAIALGGPVSDDVAAVLGRADVTSWIAAALESMWTQVVAPDWPQLLAILERDVLHRADRLVRQGWPSATTCGCCAKRGSSRAAGSGAACSMRARLSATHSSRGRNRTPKPAVADARVGRG